VSKAAGGVVARDAARKEAIEKINEEQGQLSLDKTALVEDKERKLGEMEADLTVARERDLATAGAAETSALFGAKKTFINQLVAEGQYLDTLQQEQMATGGLSARAGAAGIRTPITMQEVMGRQFEQSNTLARTQIEGARDLGVGQFGIEMGEVTRTREQYNEGSAYMNLYNLRRDDVSADSAAAIGKIEHRETFLGRQRKQQQYGWGWFGVDALGVVSDLASAFIPFSK